MTATDSRARRVLVVEDEELISLVLQDMLEMLGYSVAGVAASLAEAVPLVDAGGFEIAVLDVNLGADEVYPLADRIAAAGAALVFATGTGAGALPDRFRQHTLLPKPYAMAAVERALAGAFA